MVDRVTDLGSTAKLDIPHNAFTDEREDETVNIQIDKTNLDLDQNDLDGEDMQELDQ